MVPEHFPTETAVQGHPPHAVATQAAHGAPHGASTQRSTAQAPQARKELHGLAAEAERARRGHRAAVHSKKAGGRQQEPGRGKPEVGARTGELTSSTNVFSCHHQKKTPSTSYHEVRLGGWGSREQQNEEE